MNLLSSPVLNLGRLQRMLINASQRRFNRRFSELHMIWCSRRKTNPVVFAFPVKRTERQTELVTKFKIKIQLMKLKLQ